MEGKNHIIEALQLIDPILQFLLKATGEIDVPLSSLVKAFPTTHRHLLKVIPELMQRGVIRWDVVNTNELISRDLEGRNNRNSKQNNIDLNNVPQYSDADFLKCLDELIQPNTNDKQLIPTTPKHEIIVGFPYRCNPQSSRSMSDKAIRDQNQSLHGCTKTAANKRLKHLLANESSMFIDLTGAEDSKKPSSNEIGISKAQSEKSVVDKKKEDCAIVDFINLVSSRSSESFEKVSGCTFDIKHRDTSEETMEGSNYKSTALLHSKEVADENRHLYDDVKRRRLQQHVETHSFISPTIDDAVKVLDAIVEQNMIETGKSSQKCDDMNEQEGYKVESDEAVAALLELFSSQNCKSLNPKQASYAGCRSEREAQYKRLSTIACSRIPPCLGEILKLDLSQSHHAEPSEFHEKYFNRLYNHQCLAVESIFDGCHTLISTGTGSGKSLCFTIPIVSDVIRSDQHKATDESSFGGCVALLLFPTKALAQDQLSKLRSLLALNKEAEKHCRPGIIDGDTPHECREAIVSECNIILTNPDTLHAHMLINWKKYKDFLSRVRYIAIDELHLYCGIFGSHVRMVLSRLVRLCCCSSLEVGASQDKPNQTWMSPIFIGCSATVAFPEEHFRFLCPISVSDRICILDSQMDGSPCPRKYYFLWNSPILENMPSRRHAADETAELLAQAVRLGIRSIAFCATRKIAEWVYEKCSALLSMDDKSLLEIYRGGYSTEVRRKIEQRLFCNEIVAVVATSALEVGVDIGGIDVTFHCGYPGSLNSLTQQAGRAGRDKKTNKPSFSITICFDSPAEQHLWKNPTALLTNNKLRPSSLPMNVSLVQGHLLCAAEEIPLTGSHPASLFYGSFSSCLQSDKVLFGGDLVYDEAIDNLMIKGSLVASKLSTASVTTFDIHSAHPSTKEAWKTVSIRSIEPLNYSIVDLHHPQQCEKMDRIHHRDAVLDTIPYSRVFFHAYPGAIIAHRGKRYEIIGMSTPPRAGSTCYGDLMAFAKQVKAKYLTAALSVTTLTIVKYLGRLEISGDKPIESNCIEKTGPSLLAGHGVINVKKQVHAYKKLSLVDRSELSREEIRLPPMEYDSNALWIDVDASKLRSELKNFDEGAHALSHALIALAPVFVPCSYSDIDCDHSHYCTSRILIYDTRAGGSGTSARLWDQIFEPKGLLESAIELLSECPSRCHRGGHNGGCPACIQAVPCADFQNGLSTTAAVAIGKHLLHRIKSNTCNYHSENSSVSPPDISVLSPRRKRRLVDAADLERARERHIMIGRPSWHTDE